MCHPVSCIAHSFNPLTENFMGTWFVCYMARIMKIIMQLSALLQETKASLAFLQSYHCIAT
uniref:Uncharacterized protein n=1 Tax=Anguilla anguilla TaxID=7936 RepID=A0A0E9WG98_ANGAN